MLPHTLTNRLADGATAVFGSWLFLREPLVAEAASKLGYDYVCVDLQHGLAGNETAATMLMAIATGTACPYVRAPSQDPTVIGRLVDAGALGVIVPMVNSAAEAAAAAAACRYAPKGTRSAGPIGANVRFGGSYVAVADDHVAVFPMVETVQAVEVVEEIAATPGIAGIYVGPADLSMTMGLPFGLDQDDPGFDAAIARIVAACEANRVIPGIHAEPELVEKRRAQGFRMITVGYDYRPVLDALHADLARSRSVS